MKKDTLKSYLLTGSVILLIFALIILIICLVLREVAPDIFYLLKNGSQQDMEDYVRSAGSIGSILLFALQFLQVLSIIMMGLPIQLTAGVVCGALKGYLICEAGFLSGNLFVFLLVRRLGRLHFIQLLLEKFKTQTITHARNPLFMVLLASMMPGIPNGIIPYAAAQTSLSLREFALAIFFGSSVGIFISCTVGAHLLEGNYLIAALLFSLQLILIFILYKNKARLVHFYEHLKN